MNFHKGRLGGAWATEEHPRRVGERRNIEIDWQLFCQASLETGLDKTDASIANIVRLLKFIPGKTFYEIGTQSYHHHRLLKLIQTHQEPGQPTISYSVESSLRGWTTHSSALHTPPIRAGWGLRSPDQTNEGFQIQSLLHPSPLYPSRGFLSFRNSIWFLSSIPEVKNFIDAVQDEGRRKLVRYVS